MNWVTWVIIGLVTLSYMQYTFPDKVHPYISPIWDKVNDFIKIKQTCTAEVEPVCSNNVTYINQCYAQKAGVTNAIKGECI